METKNTPTQNPAQNKTVFVKLLEWSPGYVILETDYGYWKIREEDWDLVYKNAHYIGGVYYFVHAADIVWLGIKYNYPIDENLAREVIREVLEGAEDAPHVRAWVVLMQYVMRRLGYVFSEDDDSDDAAFEEAVEAAEEYIRKWVEGEVSLAQ
jgi:hypothetical protein